MSREDRVKQLAEEFGVTPAATRVRLQQIRLIRPQKRRHRDFARPLRPADGTDEFRPAPGIIG